MAENDCLGLTLIAVKGYLLHTEGNQVVHRSKGRIDE
jgi:hypothetical protein